MALVSDGAFVADGWRRLAEEESLPQSGKTIVSLARLPAARDAAHLSAIGVHVANTTDPAALAPYFSRLSLIAIDFPAFTDGRGFSLATLLRRAGFAATLRASGQLTPDQYLHAIGAGFDEIELPDELAARHGEANWAQAARARGLSYQRGRAGGASILERRRQGA